MKKITMIAAAAACAISAAIPAAAPAAAVAQRSDAAIGQEARIAFPNARTIRDFRATSRDTVYIQDRQRRWYRASVLSACLELPYALALGVDTRRSASLDRYSTLIVRGERCQLNSFVRIAGPPPRLSRG